MGEETIEQEARRLLCKDDEISSMYAEASGCDVNYHQEVVARIIRLRRYHEAMAEHLVDAEGVPLSGAEAVERVRLMLEAETAEEYGAGQRARLLADLLGVPGNNRIRCDFRAVGGITIREIVGGKSPAAATWRDPSRPFRDESIAEAVEVAIAALMPSEDDNATRWAVLRMLDTYEAPEDYEDADDIVRDIVARIEAMGSAPSTPGIAADPATPQPGEWLPKGMGPTVAGVWWDSDGDPCRIDPDDMVLTSPDRIRFVGSAMRWAYIGPIPGHPPAEPAPEGVWLTAEQAREGWTTNRNWLIDDNGGMAEVWGSNDSPSSDYDDALFYLVPEAAR